MKTKVWSPCKEEADASLLTSFIKKVNKEFNLSINSFSELHEWSVTNSSEFWEISAEALDMKFHTKPNQILKKESEMMRTKWFDGATLNYAENCLLNRSNNLAIFETNETGLQNTLTRDDLYQHVSKWHQFFKENGIKKGDRVAGILPNNLTAVLAMFGATSLGAVWSSCSPDFGEQGICDRLEQIQPKCIISLPEYKYKGKDINIVNRLNSIKDKLKFTHLWINAGSQSIDGWVSESKINQRESSDIDFVPCQFQDPLFILFSSGTTGKPKCIVHSIGGTLLQHKKEHQFHCDLKPNETLFYYTTCGWMMWNWMVSALASNVSLVLYDGAAITPKCSIWDLIEAYGINVFGCSASFIGASEKRKIDITKKLKCKSTRLILSTGSPLLPNHYDFLYSNFDYPIQVGSISGGTDIISCFALCNPLSPVYRGVIQGKGLGMDIAAYDNDCNQVYEVKGDLVCKNAAPSMPIYFLNDENNNKYKSAYFKDGSVYEWFHGDYIIVNNDGSIEILGRSDSTLNPGGIRIGTAEFYQILDHFDYI
ncbi:MAG: acetoacetate--CoA ligase, partial [Candidatus Margulisiibacteriota bacterium]